jgi:hypothetical protein
MHCLSSPLTIAFGKHAEQEGDCHQSASLPSGAGPLQLRFIAAASMVASQDVQLVNFFDGSHCY